jgi:hypothetical protein
MKFPDVTPSKVSLAQSLAVRTFILYGTRVWWDGLTSNQKPMINWFDRGRLFEDLV